MRHFVWSCYVLCGKLHDQKFNFATPGRNGNYDSDSNDSNGNGEQTTVQAGTSDPQIIKIIHLLGGKDNIKDVDACMTRLRVSVADREKVGSEEEWKRAGAMGLIVKDNGVQAVYGPKADVLKSDIEDLLRSGAPIPAPVEEVVVEKETANNQTLGIRKELQTVAAGEVIDLATVNDPVFSKK